MKYFEGLREEKDVKARYRELAKKHHPDLGGDAEVMKIVTAQYEEVLAGCYQDAGKSITEIEELLKQDVEVARVLRKLLVLEDVKVEVCGLWIWISGNTRQYKDQLKGWGCMWAPKKEMWYWRAAEHKKTGWRRNTSIDEIRAKYGSAELPRMRYAAVN